jgi:hypothetical protein
VKELEFRTKAEMHIEWGDIPENVFNIRYDAYEKNRKHGLTLVRQERKEVIKESQND